MAIGCVLKGRRKSQDDCSFVLSARYAISETQKLLMNANIVFHHSEINFRESRGNHYSVGKFFDVEIFKEQFAAMVLQFDLVGSW